MNTQNSNELLLELATEKHVASLLLIQEAFLQYTASEKSNYAFAYEVSNDPLSEIDFHNIVSRNECVILINGDVPLGYMLIDTCSQTKGYQEFQQSISQLIEVDKVDQELRQMPRFIEVLNPQLYQDEYKELRWQMLSYLIYTNKEKYQGLCYTFFTNASTLIEKIGMGWKIAFDNGLYYYLVWKFSQFEFDN